MIDRRRFLKLAGASSPLLMLAPDAIARTGSRPRVLVLVELKGGNDGLNTVIPFRDPAYGRLRPGLAIASDQVLGLDAKTGLHPALAPMMESWTANQLAIVQGVGYDQPNRSHFRSIEIWETASDATTHLHEGWLSQVLAGQTQPGLITEGVAVGNEDDGPMRGSGMRSLSLANPERFFKATKRLIRPTHAAAATNPALAHVLKTQNELHAAAEKIERKFAQIPASPVSFPRNKIGRQLEIAARLIAANVPLMVIKVTHGSFDTHANQAGQHRNLLGQLATSLKAFRDAMIQAGAWNDVMVMTYSEFGRRAAENGSRGTDHGTAAPQLLMGGKVKGGLYGKQPSLTDLAGGDLKHHVDFRRVYASVTREWWGLSGRTPAGKKPLGLIRA